jgi:prepilin-type N-terminal cleavage/methylation domain-containing protein/prepilin-type processing-associated H-X9-DG protein
MRVGRNNTILAARGRSGFTLIELLVVVTIIAIVAAIMFPVVAKVKQRAQIAECLSNMKQVGSALRVYVDEYNGKFPPAAPMGIPWRTTESTIQELLAPYVRSGVIAEKIGGSGYKYPVRSVFCCPSDTGIAKCDDGYLDIHVGKPVWLQTGCSYIYYASNQENRFLRNRPRVPWTALSPQVSLTSDGSQEIRIGAPESAIPYPSRKAAMGDVWFWHLGDTIPPNDDVAWCNTLFVDGHAARVQGAIHVQSRIETLNPHWHNYLETGE